MKTKRKKEKHQHQSTTNKKGIVQHAHALTHTHTRARCDQDVISEQPDGRNVTAALLALALAHTLWHTLSNVNEAKVRNVMALQYDLLCLTFLMHITPYP